MLSLPVPSRKTLYLGMTACELVAACSDNNVNGPPSVDLNLSRIAGFDPLKAALVAARKQDNGGFNLDMWAAVVDRNGLVVAVVFTGATVTAQGPGSRAIASQKGNTANAYSPPHLALTTTNPNTTTQPLGTQPVLQEATTHNKQIT